VPFNYTFRADDLQSVSSEDRDLLENRDRELELFLQLAVNPTGAVLPYAGATAPSGYLLCDGSTFNGDQYPELRDCLGDTYGVHSGTSYYLPNLKGRVPVGKDASQTEFDAMGETGGAKTHTLSQTEMPVHTHIQNAHSHIIDGALIPRGTGSDFREVTDAGAGTSNVTTRSETATNQNAGGGGAHNNLQPYVVLNYIIKT
jgi:microcystin-dependent protein